MYAPLATPDAAPYFVRSKVGTACRLSTSAAGSCFNCMMTFHASTTSFASAGPHHHQARHGAQRRQLLDRLMRGTVFAQADGIVGEHVDGRQSPSAPPAGWRPHVVAEVEERAAEGRTLTPPCHSKPRPCRVRALRSAGCVRRSCRPESLPRHRTSSAFGRSRPGRRSRRPAREHSCAIAFKTFPELSRVAMPFASAGKLAGSCPSRRAVRAAACD